MPQMIDKAGNIWETSSGVPVLVRAAGAPSGGGLALGGNDPNKDASRRSTEVNTATNEAQFPYAGPQAAATLANTKAELQAKKLAQAGAMRNDYEANQAVKIYNSLLPTYAAALQSPATTGGDQGLVYAIAKIMAADGSAVREGEVASTANLQPYIDQIKGQFAKQMDNAGNLTPEGRQMMREALAQKMARLNEAYIGQRVRFKQMADRHGINPLDVVGEHTGIPFQKDEAKFLGHEIPQADYNGNLVPPPSTKHSFTAIGPGGRKITFDAPADATDDQIRALGAAAANNPSLANSQVQRDKNAPQEKGNYQDSYVGQGMSGVNDGIAGVLGGPVDLMTGALNLIPKGINFAANTDLPTITNPIAGGQWFKDRMSDMGSTFAPSADPSKQFVRRVGESVGAAAIPLSASTTLPRMGAQMLAGFGGGVGGATAQRAFPNNPLAEFAGEMAGGGLTTAGMFGAAKRSAQRQIEAAVPTTQQLREQAGELYRQAEARGVTADPTQTGTLANNMRAALQNEGRISPTGRISEVYPKAKEGMQLVDDYSGQQMNPTQMQTVRSVISDALASPDKSERRLGGILTDTFDQWSAPLAPELPKARDIASRYLNAEQLEKARDLARASNSQFTASGMENALRTQYRNLDKSAIQGKQRYSNALTDAIETVNRGTPASNFARNLGRFAPTGPVSLGVASGVPALVGGSVAGLPGALVGGSVGLAGIAGRAAATKMGMRNADLAELVARNGGPLAPVDLMTPEMRAWFARGGAAQSAKYLPQQ
jgi:hypothetical protein